MTAATHTYAWSGATVTAGVLDEHAIEAFTEGDCSTFAVALARLTGGTVHEIVTTVNGEPHLVQHFVVVLADGRYADVEGTVDQAGLLERWARRCEPAGGHPAGTEFVIRAADPIEFLEHTELEMATTIAAVAVERYQLN